jgi:hypothetical protein
LKEEKENMLRHQPENKSSDHMGRREAGESSNCQQSANQYDRPKGRDFGRKRNLPPCLQQAPSRDEEDTFVSPDIHEHPRRWNIGQQSINQGHCPNRNLPPRLQQAQSRNEENFVSPEIHEHPRTWNIGQQSTYQGHRPNRNLPPRLQNTNLPPAFKTENIHGNGHTTVLNWIVPTRDEPLWYKEQFPGTHMTTGFNK